MQRRGHQVNVLERDPRNDEQGGGIQGRQGNTFARAGVVVGAMFEGVHGFNGFRFPVWNDVAFVFIQTEMGTDIDVEVILVAFVTEERVGATQRIFVNKRRKAC
jgi:hypothetical protein